MRLTTDRLLLRDYQMEDWERVHLYAAIPEFSRFEAWGPNTIEDTKKYVSDMVRQAATQPRYKFDLAVCVNEGEQLIGGCGIRRETEASHVANLGWAINPDFQGQGYATEAARALIDFGFGKLNLKVIYATCDALNAASYRVMEKLGMRRVGFMKGDIQLKGRLRDSYRYEILRS